MGPKAKEKKEEQVNIVETKQGEFVFPNNDTYKGEYKIDDDQIIKRHGYGTFTTSSGMTYTGLWDEDKMSGKGYLTFADGSAYEGEFLNNQFEGNGTYIWPNGRVYKGLFVNNKLQGEGSFCDNENQTWTGNFHYKAAPGLRFVLNL